MVSRRFDQKSEKKSSVPQVQIKEIEREEAQNCGKTQIWRPKQKADEGKPSDINNMAFFLPTEFRDISKDDEKNTEEGIEKERHS